MPYAMLSKQFTFDAAHHLPHHGGKCARPHGHTYTLEVTVRGPIKQALSKSDHGMVLDFADLSHIVKEAVIARLDHYDLNIVTGVYTTVENLIHWIWDALVAAGLPDDLLYRIRLWETPTSFVEITHAERG